PRGPAMRPCGRCLSDGIEHAAALSSSWLKSTQSLRSPLPLAGEADGRRVGECVASAIVIPLPPSLPRERERERAGSHSASILRQFDRPVGENLVLLRARLALVLLVDEGNRAFAAEQRARQDHHPDEAARPVGRGL